MIKELHEAFKNIKYHDSNHTYTGSTGQFLTSVTQYIKKLTPPFPSDYMSIFTALKESGYKVKSDKAKEKKIYTIEGVDYTRDEVLTLDLDVMPDQIKKRWSHQGLIGSTRGTMLHDYMENLLANKFYPVTYTNAINSLPADEFIKFHKSVDVCKEYMQRFIQENPNLIPIKSELIVGDEELGIAGTVDQLYYDTDTGKYHLYDWKTDKKIDTSNYWTQYNPPLAHLDSCRFNKYSLQVNGLYRHIIEKNLNIELGDSYVVWFNMKNDSYIIIKLKDLKNEINALFYSKKIYEI